MPDNTVWIVIPVYNAEKTLKKCVKSIQKQTYKNWKIVLVDDGSKDKSGALCDKFAAKDSRIIAVHQPNAGPSAARKKGMTYTDDDGYCTFCDSDDWLPKNALELMMNEVIKHNADMVCGRIIDTYGYVRFPMNQNYSCFLNPKTYTKKEMSAELLSAFLGLSSQIMPVSMCGKIYRNRIIKPVILDDCVVPKKYAEDLDVNLRAMPLYEKCSIINEEVYYYRRGGGTSGFMPEIFSDSLIMYNRKKKYTEFYTGEQDVYGLISAELLTYAVTYLTICKRFEKYSMGSLAKETEYVCSLPEIREALDCPNSKKLFWSYEGAWDCMKNNDIQGLEKIVVDYVEMLKQRTFIKKVISVLKK